MSQSTSFSSILTSKYFKVILFSIHFFVTLFFLYKNQPWLTGDSARYLNLSANLRNGIGFGLIRNNVFQSEGLRDIGYPLFIAICQSITFTETFGVVIIQCLLFFASVVLIWKVTETTFGRVTATCFLMLSAFYPFISYSASQISPETVTVFLISLSTYLLLTLNSKNVFLAALCISLSAYFRANLIFLTVFIAFIFFVLLRQVKYSLIIIFTAIIVATPNILRNYQVFGKLKPIPVHSATGHSLLVATWQTKISARSIIDYGTKGIISDEMKQTGIAEEIQTVNNQANALSETVVITPENYETNEIKIKANETCYNLAITNIRESPFLYLKSSFINFFRLWFTANFPDSINILLRILFLIQGLTILFLGIIGSILIVCQSGKKNLSVVFALATMVYLSLTLCWLHTEARYTISARLLLVMFASVSLNYLINKFIILNSHNIKSV